MLTSTRLLSAEMHALGCTAASMLSAEGAAIASYLLATHRQPSAAVLSSGSGMAVAASTRSRQATPMNSTSLSTARMPATRTMLFTAHARSAGRMGLMEGTPAAGAHGRRCVASCRAARLAAAEGTQETACISSRHVPIALLASNSLSCGAQQPTTCSAKSWATVSRPFIPAVAAQSRARYGHTPHTFSGLSSSRKGEAPPGAQWMPFDWSLQMATSLWPCAAPQLRAVLSSTLQPEAKLSLRQLSAVRHSLSSDLGEGQLLAHTCACATGWPAPPSRTSLRLIQGAMLHMNIELHSLLGQATPSSYPRRPERPWRPKKQI
jgi:hypothetical protein